MIKVVTNHRSGEIKFSKANVALAPGENKLERETFATMRELEPMLQPYIDEGILSVSSATDPVEKTKETKTEAVNLREMDKRAIVAFAAEMGLELNASDSKEKLIAAVEAAMASGESS